MQCIFCNNKVPSLKHHLPSCVTMHPKPRNPVMRSEMKRRLSFNLWPGNFSEEFVTAGLYFTGNEDILTCFWCNHAMGNWDSEEDPLERHLNENPSCQFIFYQCETISLCPFCKKMVPQAKKLPGSSIKGHDERCLETAIATLDEPSKFPRNFRMGNASNRLKSFKKWPKSETSIQDFINSGFYYTGKGDDAVTCFYCSVTLKNWSPLDDPIKKHVSNSPSCVFVQNLLNKVQLSDPVDYEGMKMESGRIKTFNNWSLKTDSKVLAKSGFFYLEYDDLLECAFCKVIIPSKEFQVSDPPLKVHERKSPMCSFLRTATSIANPLYPDMLNPMDRLRTFANCSEKNILDFVKSGFYVTGSFVKCFWCGFETKLFTKDVFKTHAEKRSNCMFAQNACFQELNRTSEKSIKDNSYEDYLLCIVCCNKEREIVFEDCGHLMCCRSCASRFDKCPGCRKHISYRLRIYIS